MGQGSPLAAGSGDSSPLLTVAIPLLTVAIPEPTTALMLSILTGAFLTRRRRKQPEP